MIELKNVSKTYKSKKGVTTRALSKINLKFGNNGLVFIVGKSGSGKSTLLNLIGGLDSCDEGKIIVNNKEISSLKEKELDLYRNSYVGFIFQEFNLLEEFNVKENIEISLKLQNITDDKSIDNILDNVDLKKLGSRNINELSGGQKQRVSIARALIKKPKLILADEPTGNLDRKSSDQIFEILKNISKDELVIVVSHDIESANIYADRIIRIEDGKIIDDNLKNEIKENEKNSEFIKSKLPFSYMLKMAYSYIMSKPFRLVLTILITMITLSFMCFAINVYLFDGTSLHLNVLNKNNNYVLNIYNAEVTIEDESTRQEKRLKINDDNVNYLENYTKSIVNKEYNLYENGTSLEFGFGPITDDFIENDAFDSISTNLKFVELKDKKIIPNIIGNYPNNDNEIVVHKYFADYIINFGIKDENDILYFPKDYNEIVSSNKLIKLSSHLVKITGIVDDKNDLFKRAMRSGSFWSEDLKRFYMENYSSKASVIYVNNSFINSINLKNELNLRNITLRYNGFSNEDEIKQLNENNYYIDLNGEYKKIDKLNKDEVIISLDFFRIAYSNYNNDLEKYLNDNKELSYTEIIKRYTSRFILNNNISDRIILVDNSQNNEKRNEYKLVGISIDNNNFISDKYESVDENQKVISSVYVYCNNNKILKNIFNEFTYLYDKSYFLPGQKYFVSYDNSMRVSTIIYVYSRIKRYLLSLSLVFICFTLLIILNFISNSITNYKKEIGILRSIGATNRDIIKIFGCETMIIALISWLFGIIIWLIECYYLNNSMFGDLYFKINGILINPIVPIIILLFNIITSMMITILLIDKISQVKPIDVILDR